MYISGRNVLMMESGSGSLSIKVRKLRRIYGAGRAIDRTQKWRCGRGTVHIRFAVIGIFVYHLFVTMGWIIITVILLRETMTVFWAVGFVFGFILLVPLFAAPVGIYSQNPDPFLFYRISLGVRIMVQLSFGVANLVGLHGCDRDKSSDVTCELTGLSHAWQWCTGLTFLAAAFIDISFFFVADKFNKYLHQKRDWYVREFFPEAKSEWNEEEWDPPLVPHIPFQNNSPPKTNSLSLSDPPIPQNQQKGLSDEEKTTSPTYVHPITENTEVQAEKLTDLSRIGNLFEKAEDMQRLVEEAKVGRKYRPNLGPAAAYDNKTAI